MPTDAPKSQDVLESLRDKLRDFANERDWEQFHSPKNLAAALSVEVAEVLEHFQWLTDTEAAHLTPETLAKLRLELADVLLYLVRLADRLSVDLTSAARDKLVINAQRYPADRVRGTAKKYTDL